MSMHRIMIYTRFERLWHWLQAGAILTLLFTGLRIHGIHTLISFETAVNIHTAVATGLLVLWAFATFWLFTTGNWRHYMPTRQGLWRIVRFYSYGIFQGEHHPYRKAFWRKHNPLQAAAYLGVKVVIFPMVWISGLIYLYLVLGGTWTGLVNFPPAVALVHTLAAFALILFLMIHLYMLTIGKGFIHHVTPMIDGFDEVDLSVVEEAYLAADEPGHIKDNADG
ncbi:cytochrome b/b6 domain-containing protein [Mariprofundus ferrooxydans]|uniref:cytochrome b/b6 domain-containing protein n=1 Tax=Mariprofundus ferrooxydans TaxID=314344 RepID=UPI00037A42CD|nr:cytochrome b/b6 domain-containing protein [Mariprofundus ferrooxydans]